MLRRKKKKQPQQQLKKSAAEQPMEDLMNVGAPLSFRSASALSGCPSCISYSCIVDPNLVAVCVCVCVCVRVFVHVSEIVWTYLRI